MLFTANTLKIKSNPNVPRCIFILNVSEITYFIFFFRFFKTRSNSTSYRLSEKNVTVAERTVKVYDMNFINNGCTISFT